ncbi:MAG TPA: RNA polymerase sigma factor region1.1 domain-containing protein [Azospirillaceae bacterium]|nr:RNA polymerase sigma factor region1.1 domain-containing protein [Azospirillaceae bacterium]
MAVAAQALDRLVALGRERGSLTPEEIGRELPLADMAPTEIAFLIERLDAEGVAVEFDELLFRRPRGEPTEPTGEALLPANDPGLAPATATPVVRPPAVQDGSEYGVGASRRSAVPEPAQPGVGEDGWLKPGWVAGMMAAVVVLILLVVG